MPEQVICDTSPLFYLHRLQHLSLLQNLYQHILAPEAVVAELRAGYDQREDVPDLAHYNWIKIHRVRTEDALPLMTDLGAGEAHVWLWLFKHPAVW